MGGTETFGEYLYSQQPSFAPSLVPLLIMSNAFSSAAPERHIKHEEPLRAPTPVSQTIDVWSLGCVLSIAATWVVLGYQGIQQFEKLRRKAIAESQKSRRSRGAKSTNMDGDWFHDGVSVLADVTSWHKVLRGFVRRTDVFTIQVLDLIDQRMLRGPPTERHDAKSICNELKRISSSSKGEHRDAISESVINVLLEVDEEAPYKIVRTPSEVAAEQSQSQHAISQQDIKARKLSRLDFPVMKTANRSALIAQVERVLVSTPTGDGSAEKGATRPQQLKIYESASSHAKSVPALNGGSHAHAEILNRESLHIDVPSRHKHQNSKTHQPQDVFQTRGLIEDRQTAQTMFIKRTKKDEELTKYFKNRDIVSQALYLTVMLNPGVFSSH